MTSILVVEDDKTIALLLTDVLEDEGYTVQHAEHGRMALRMLDEQSFTLIITDMMMPVMNGMELCQELVQRGQHPPIIVLSAAAHLMTVGEGGATAILSKPFVITQLLDTVHHIID